MRSVSIQQILILCSCFAALAFVSTTPPRPVHAQDSSTLSHDRLALKVPGVWQTAKQNKVLRAQPPFTKAGGLILQPAAQFGASTAPAAAAAIAKRFEKGRRVVKKFPDAPQTGVTKSGAGFAFQSRVSRGVGQDVWYTAYYTFSAGGSFQTVIVLAKEQNAFKQLMKELAPALDTIEVRLEERNPGRGVSLSKNHAFFNYTAKLPARWRPDEGAVANLSQFEIALKRQAYLAEPFQAAVELQLSRPNSPVAALVRFLESRVLWNYRGSYSSRTSLKFLSIGDGRLPNGLHYVSVVIEKPIKYKDDDAYRKAGILVYGPDCSVLLGSAIQIDNYSRRFKNAKMNADIKAWSGVVSDLHAVAGSLQFANQNISRMAGTEARLKSKKRFRYQKEKSASNSQISFFSSTKVAWDFGADGSVRYDIDRHRSFNAYEYDEIGRPDFSSGYMEGSQGSQGEPAKFGVYSNRNSNKEYIVVRYPSGLATFHPVQFQGQQLTIDGFKDGCCR
ncbi:MAG: hypothetical protein NXI24_02095 [bacterium]|nr:hypothetical protein [bacterium]